MASQAHLDRLATKMPKIGVECFGTRHGQEHQPHDDEADHPVREYEFDSEDRVQGQKDARIVDDMDETPGAQGRKPDEHERPEVLGNLGSPMRLDHKQDDEDGTVSGSTMRSSCGAASFNPSTADKTEIAGVRTASP